MNALHPSAYRKQQRQKAIDKMKRFIGPVMFWGFVGLSVAVFFHVLTSRPTRAASQPSAPPPAVNPMHLIVANNCDDACYDTWRNQLRLKRICGITMFQYDPEHDRDVVWLGRKNDHYREIDRTADWDDVCRQEN